VIAELLRGVKEAVSGTVAENSNRWGIEVYSHKVAVNFGIGVMFVQVSS